MLPSKMLIKSTLKKITHDTKKSKVVPPEVIPHVEEIEEIEEEEDDEWE